MEQITITDEEGVKAFIEAQQEARQRACATFIASRAALRVAPHAISIYEFEDVSKKWNFLSKFVWRSLLTSGVASSMPTPEVR